jgi:hypothetical protein
MARGVLSRRTEVERILNGAARRLLAEQLDRDTVRTASTGGNGGTLHGHTDEGALLVASQSIPVVGSVQGNRNSGAA